MSEPIDIFKLWDSIAEMAEAIGDKPDTVRRWKLAKRVPEDAWERVITAAVAIGHPLTAQQIYEYNAPMLRRGKGALSAISPPVKKRRSHKPSASAA